MVLFVAALAQRFEVIPVVPSVWSVSTLHDVVHFLTSETASVARWVVHEPVPSNALPVATAEPCDMVGLKAPRVGNRRPRVEYGYSHVGTPPRIGANRPGESSKATDGGWTSSAPRRSSSHGYPSGPDRGTRKGSSARHA